jgi:hypothetical protein
MKKLLLVVALSLLAACTKPFSGESRWMDAYGPNFPQPLPGRGALYVVRNVTYEGAQPINLSIGRRAMGGLTSLTWMRFDLQPRLYDLRAFGTSASSELIITVDPGQTRFVQVDAKDGSTQILEISPQEGRRLVRLGQQVMPMEAVPEY